MLGARHRWRGQARGGRARRALATHTPVFWVLCVHRWAMFPAARCRRLNRLGSSRLAGLPGACGPPTHVPPLAAPPPPLPGPGQDTVGVVSGRELEQQTWAFSLSADTLPRRPAPAGDPPGQHDGEVGAPTGGAGAAVTSQRSRPAGLPRAPPPRRGASRSEGCQSGHVAQSFSVGPSWSACGGQPGASADRGQGHPEWESGSSWPDSSSPG